MSTLLWEAMAMVSRDVLHLVRVSLKERKSFTSVSLIPSEFPDTPFPLLSGSVWPKTRLT
jgi:hypothetical protein